MSVRQRMYSRKCKFITEFARGYCKKKIGACAAAPASKTGLASCLHQRLAGLTLDVVKSSISVFLQENQEYFPLSRCKHRPPKHTNQKESTVLYLPSISIQPTQGQRENSTQYFHILVRFGSQNGLLILLC